MVFRLSAGSVGFTVCRDEAKAIYKGNRPRCHGTLPNACTLLLQTAPPEGGGGNKWANLDFTLEKNKTHKKKYLLHEQNGLYYYSISRKREQMYHLQLSFLFFFMVS